MEQAEYYANTFFVDDAEKLFTFVSNSLGRSKAGKNFGNRE